MKAMPRRWEWRWVVEGGKGDQIHGDGWRTDSV